MDIESQIRKIAGYKTWNVQRKIDALLKIDHELYMNLGIDSMESERKIVKATSRKIYRYISRISPRDGYLLEAHMMEKDLSQ